MGLARIWKQGAQTEVWEAGSITKNIINPGCAALQGVAIPINQITFVAIYLALTAFAL